VTESTLTDCEVDNDSVVITSAGKSFQLHGPTTGRTQLADSLTN